MTDVLLLLIAIGVWGHLVSAFTFNIIHRRTTLRIHENSMQSVRENTKQTELCAEVFTAMTDWLERLDNQQDRGSV